MTFNSAQLKAQPDLKPGKILIIEDEVDIAFALQMILETSGYVAKTAENGKVALELIQNEGPFQLILLDMQMPVMNGWVFAENFYATYGNNTPIIVMTAAANSQQRAQEIKATDWIDKPFEISRLQTMIKSYLGSQENT